MRQHSGAMTNAAAGWCPDPENHEQAHWWDGHRWADRLPHTHSGPWACTVLEPRIDNVGAPLALIRCGATVAVIKPQRGTAPEQRTAAGEGSPSPAVSVPRHPTC